MIRTRALGLFFLICQTLEGVLTPPAPWPDSYFEETSPSCCDIAPFPWPHKFSFGPEIYHALRMRKGGTRQDGWVYGGRFSYERIKCFSFYWAVTGLYAEGELNGFTHTKKPLKSNFIDKQIEGRFGYNFQWCNSYQPSIIPYIAGGYFSESNNYRRPSPVTVNFEIEYPYFGFGFVSSLLVFPCLSLGLNAEGRTPYDTRCKVTNDPEYDDCSMCVGDRFNYRVELPIIYRLPYLYQTFEFGIEPFYEYRHYGGRMNFPFDFVDTRVRLWGINIQFNIRL